MLKPIRLFSLFLLLACGKAAGAATVPVPVTPLVYTVDVSKFNTDQRFTAVCLEGLANRRGPRVFLNFGSSLRWMQITGNDPKNPWADSGWLAKSQSSYTSICDYWIAELTRRKICRFQPISMADLIKLDQPELHGWICYSALDDDVSIAATMAGLRDALPMTRAVHDDFVGSADKKLPLVCDIPALYPSTPSTVSRRIAAHQWMVGHLLALCAADGAISRNKTYGLDMHDTVVDVDLGVQHRWATFDLNYLSAQTKNPGDKPDAQYGFNLPDTALIDTVLMHLKPFSPVYGWGSPDENNTVNRITMDGCVMLCGGSGNGSFFDHLNFPAKSFVQPDSRSLKPERLQNRVYVAFMVNEGDTLKCAANLQSLSWAQPERGGLPINWGVDPLLYQQFPGLMRYYYHTAATSDYFFAATSGWGYTHPERLPPKLVLPYAKSIRAGCEAARTPIIDVWWAGGLKNANLYYPFLMASGASGLTQWSDHEGVEYSPLNGMPIVDSPYYYVLNRVSPADFAKQLVADTAAIQGPWFVVVYGGTPYQFEQVAQGLPPSRFKIVTLDHFFEAAREAKQLVEGKVWRPGDRAPAVAAPGAGAAPIK